MTNSRDIVESRRREVNVSSRQLVPPLDRPDIPVLPFVDRVDAGRRLAQLPQLQRLRGQDAVVLGLPRGGVPVAFEVAKALNAPLDVIVVRKLGLPVQPEVAMGAIGEGGFEILDRALISQASVTDAQVEAVEDRERAVLADRVARLRRGRDRVDLTGRVAVIVDDGLATGASVRVACEVARHLGARRIVVAVPVAAPESLPGIPADDIVCLAAPASFVAVGYHYRDFSPTSDDDVIAILDAASRIATTATGAAPDYDVDCEIPSDGISLYGHLNLPDRPHGVIAFAHGSGSSRHSSRNRYVASVLHRAGLGTLLLDLLTPGEEHDRGNVFNIPLLAGRLSDAVRWLQRRSAVAEARIGLFGASTGAGAALWAAADPSLEIAAVVSRGGRPDLAGDRLALVTAPTLLIVGGADTAVLDLNRTAQSRLRCPNRLAIVPDATHLFEEPGTLTEAAMLAKSWFTEFLVAPDRAGRAGQGTP